MKSSVYPSDFQSRIDFEEIRAELTALSENEVGKYFISLLDFMPPSKALFSALKELKEVIKLHDSLDLPSLAFPTIRAYIKGLQPSGATLPLEGAIGIKRVLEIVTSLIQLRIPDETPFVSRLVGRLDEIRPVKQLLSRLLNDEGEIRDEASEVLYTIRREIKSIEGSIGLTLRSILAEAQAEGWVEKDAAPTMRDGRLLLPVIPSAKRYIGGIVHEESATGRTLFMEPAKIVALNNRIREAKNEEQREINRLLREASGVIRPYLRLLQQDISIIGKLDFLLAKARLARRYDAIVPEVAPEMGTMEWWKARHPILERHLKEQGKELVPLDLKLSPENRILLISGPNAGGKSAALKTVALLQYMLQCGLAVPMQSHSVCTLFDQILLDIGDRQSLQDDLSTYSSHLLSMKYFVRNVTKDSLILIDEFGSGTEPTIGGAIAEALMEHFRTVRAYGVVTTHFGNLKDYCERHDGLINGAMLFDRQKIQPLYKLFIGQAGSSFALEIARSIGLPSEILEYASDLVGSDYMQQDKYLQDIMRDKAYWANKRATIKRLERELEQKSSRLDDRMMGIQERKMEILGEAQSKALEIVASANAAVEKTIRDIKTHNAEKEATKRARQHLDNTRAKLELKKQTEERMSTTKSKPTLKSVRNESDVEKNSKRTPIGVGDKVRLDDGKSIGEVLEIKGDKVRVLMGLLNMWVSKGRLTRTNEKATEVIAPRNQIIEAQQDEHRLNFKPQIDLRGMRVDEALQQVTHFLDDAGRYGYSPVRILHGTGTGALRVAIRNLLEGNPRVKSYQDEHVDFGGAGITVVEL